MTCPCICPVCSEVYSGPLDLERHVGYSHPGVLYRCWKRGPGFDVVGAYEDFITAEGTCSHCGSKDCGDALGT